ncbi:MAG: tRNA (guanosine(37)-N1)-methyltransferase TrmD [Candidatus Zambryskibacteria bacterium RIFCSPLOWO2_02_FULL_51_21]|uniref:tRNA (guanine-N(1)-)-methyltransferase n=1 Tax=Candidatus Zambryskibacteria bacterium RIFCSPHIGHO2_02_FULL_43_37 TaxID=1802749 RepID=A0A1G2TGS0_9BACT|nr:MAG: tRNA (guanosine(37)-N1)-methyltransferase TrmD [Candidatus Zambryskibacteria bacterium RIFCSPHIGHO2_01_FULL_52_18]OHA96487.1 MAG: tRNA (guanosine(37)-N1)-methyltransferase TrmD [Candidatus Zambryskibacteria bacterium RIFCSPHIGHO2_02_FULL_43_37]OHB07157.1 MAG: tRNA (guanosine(37)-N1)-methyltransferase TrmD [Candidatus Zambryskibacteria bacterium RIFCSPLOWO2_01_FULL_52_12]OHB11250.1 MAG: tRNA (guanosine(37)-N1)-methyltransferase TrmD [Candidatus Zambryskibacteria bacterium RIFCSPLOWO2_02_F
MHFHVITLFPKAFDSYLGESILKRAIEDKKIKVTFYNPRDFVENKWKRVDRPPYGGGPGLVIEALPVIKAIEKALKRTKKAKIIWLSPNKKQFTNEYAHKAAKLKHLVIVCGRYEGIDARVKKVFKMEEVSVGPYVLTGGELPAMVIMDTVSRQVPGVLGNIDSLEERRVASSDAYTRPEVFKYKNKSYKVPKILLSGHRAKIEEWKKKGR